MLAAVSAYRKLGKKLSNSARCAPYHVVHAESSDLGLAKEWSCMSDCRITLVETGE